MAMENALAKRVIPAFLLLTIIVSALVYYRFLAFSEGRVIAQGSMESYILIPNLLKDQTLIRIGSVKDYYYRPAEGPKPAITEVTILADGEKRIIKEYVSRYFLTNGFKENKSRELWRGKQEVSVSFKKTSKGLWAVNIAALDHIQ